MLRYKCHKLIRSAALACSPARSLTGSLHSPTHCDCIHYPTPPPSLSWNHRKKRKLAPRRGVILRGAACRTCQVPILFASVHSRKHQRRSQGQERCPSLQLPAPPKLMNEQSCSRQHPGRRPPHPGPGMRKRRTSKDPATCWLFCESNVEASDCAFWNGRPMAGGRRAAVACANDEFHSPLALFAECRAGRVTSCAFRHCLKRPLKAAKGRVKWLAKCPGRNERRTIKM